MKKLTASILSATLMLSMVFSSSVFAANDATTKASAWDSFVGLFTKATATTETANVQYRGHVQDYGDVPVNGTWVQEDNQLGTTGESKRIEGFKIELTDGNTLPAGTQIRYNVHVENEGWLHDKNDIVNTGSWEKDGAFAGSVAKSQRVEAIEIVLTDANGVKLDGYSVQYMVHGEDYGWSQGWVADGAIAGTEGQSKRLEAIRIKIVKTQANLDGYNTALSEVTQADYTTASWTTYQAVVNANKVTADNTQTQVDTATANIKAAQANLVLIPKVTNVTAVNGRTVTIAFNTAIDSTTLIDTKSTTVTTDDVVKTGVVKFTALDGQTSPVLTSIAAANASLSADGKTLTLVATTTDYFTARYTVDVTNAVKDTAGNKITAYSTILDTKDQTQPTVTDTSYQDGGFTFKVQFSEPMKSIGTVKLYNGTTELSAPTTTFTAGNSYFTVDLSPSAIPVNTALTLQVFGSSDYNSNIITPNPYTTTITKTAVDTVAPTVTKTEGLSDSRVKVTFSEKINATAPTITIGGTAATVTAVDTDRLAFYADLTSGSEKTGVQPVAVSAFTDMAGNAGTAYNGVVTMKADTVAPTLVSSSVVKINGIENLILTFDKNVTPITAKTFVSTSDRYTDVNNISQAVATALTTNTSTNYVLYNAVDGKSASVALDITTLAKGTYTITVPAGVVQSVASTPKDNATKSITFVRGENSSVIKPTVTPSVIDNNTIEFVYSEFVDSTATDLANYNIDGISLKSAEFYGTQKVVRVHLNAGANTITGDRTVSVKNVQSTSGVVMDNSSTTLTMNENVAPTYTATLIDDNIIKVVSSEPIANPTLSAAILPAQFAVTYDGSDDTVTVYADAACTTTPAAVGTSYKTFYLKLANPVTDLAKTLTVSATTCVDVNAVGSVDGTTIKLVGNVISPAVVTVAK